MSLLFNIAIDGIAYGMILFMISVGLSVTMGLMRVINLAHGAFALIGGVLAHVLILHAGIGYLTAVPLAIAGVVIVALAGERVLFRRVYRLGELQQVLATIGLTFMVIAVVSKFLGSSLLAIPLPASLQQSVDLGFRVLPAHRLVVILAGLAVIAALYLTIERSRFGTRLRAAVDNRNIASALGIDTDRIYAATFCLGAGLAALGGILGAELLPIDAYYPLRYMVLFLIVVSVGGLGSISGSFVAALALGTLETASRYLIPDFGTVVFLAAVMALLALRPAGLLGRV
ncbi:branched-chain amino acid ABC transporter permease [Neorhizobium galegae]|uniref:Inner-membrane translocator n=1 Tax=Neorhizobium galegae bv. orientalis str. HAMBI 540 TaxID=1028800 RepID=A0A068SZ14_NEOGA|nr:branched-chain amino acid ABC transporter permease [Neorhizobium galegae]MCQ1852873.1 branched-chain amino acid ABC transporter permease [Neorhizobium galegae]CDN51076.1 Inner-membrane translocator [Neorhizobium galegae bv. orientalis str. HAMBI 540]CDZ44158.1 Inner-membrane translocator [Neorhizobium galegae bv. orientalis]